MCKKIHQVFISLNSPTKFSYNRSIDVEVHCAVIEYGNGKAKPAHYLIRLTDLEDLDDQRQEWFSERQGVVTDPTLARAIGFFQHLSHNVGINRTTKNISALWKHYFHLS